MMTEVSICCLSDPATGVAVYVNAAWTVVGGTSVGAPLIAGEWDS